MVHARRKGAGHFWQGRFGAVAMDRPHPADGFRYMTLNPVRAKLARQIGLGRAHAPTWASAATPPRTSPRHAGDFPSSPTCHRRLR